MSPRGLTCPPLNAPAETAGEQRNGDIAVGTAVALATLTMMFTGLMFAYGFLRLRAPAWPPINEARLPRVAPAWATGAAAIASLALGQGEKRRRSGRRYAHVFTAVALASSSIFLALQALTWRQAWDRGLRPSSGPYGSVFFCLTIVHALHMAAALGAVAWLAFLERKAPLAARSAGGRPGLFKANVSSARGSAVSFFHFLTGVWFVVYVGVYVL